MVRNRQLRPARTRCPLAAHPRCILSGEALTGSYVPQPFLDVADDDDLIALAADLWNQRQALMLGTR
jgi:hypothetical protein